MSDDTGAKIEGPYTYDPHGNCFSGGSSCNETGVPYRFTGRRFDAETGLLYYRARYYWPKGGRFMQTDPIGYTANLNLYTYVGNDPTDKVDPKGTDAVWVVDQNTGITTLVIPVQFTGQDASAANVGAIVSRDNSLSISTQTCRFR